MLIIQNNTSPSTELCSEKTISSGSSLGQSIEMGEKIRINLIFFPDTFNIKSPKMVIMGTIYYLLSFFKSFCVTPLLLPIPLHALCQNIHIKLFHALKVAFGTFGIAKFAAGVAVKSFVFKDKGLWCLVIL